MRVRLNNKGTNVFFNVTSVNDFLNSFDWDSVVFKCGSDTSGSVCYSKEHVSSEVRTYDNIVVFVD